MSLTVQSTSVQLSIGLLDNCIIVQVKFNNAP